MNFILLASMILFMVSVYLSKNRLRTQKSLLGGTLIIFIYMILTVFFIVSDYFTGEGINDAVIYHLRYGLDDSGFGDYYNIISIGLFLFIASLTLSIFYYRMVKNSVVVHHHIVKRLLSGGFLIVALVLHPTVKAAYTMASKALGFESALGQKYPFTEYYKTPNVSALSDEHPNLVYIFAESFETTYFDEDIFPSLVKQLRGLKEQSLYFTDIRQALGTSWTIAGMTSVLCGLPLVTPSTNAHSPQGNSMSKMSSFYSGATCLSDLLHEEGYTLTYRSGSSLAFAGVDKLYKTHHFGDVKGVKELKNVIKNPNYKNPWGLYDDTLLDIAFNDFKKLSSSKRKFALFLSTMDTHHPYGHVSKSCQRQTYKDGTNSMLNAVACSDELITKFIKQIQNSPYGKNTVIVVGSDHLAMHNLAIDDLMKGERRDLFMIFPPTLLEHQIIDKPATTLDIGATILPFLGYKGQLGLGRDILSEEGTLIERLDDFEKILSAWSTDISQFWGFPKIERDITIDSNRKGTKIGKSLYKFPILLRISDTLEVNPFFEVKLKHFETPKLFNYLQEFQDNDTFLWIDKCSRVASLGETIDMNGKLCFAIGKLGSTIEMGVLNKEKVFSLEAIQKEFLVEATHEKALLRKEGLSQIIEK
ncbi:MAG: sulfatase-like hydrolase/transferase [Sulfurospirillaceae bacterium]|nr:sulfatase-like hydrolase/transferase [Sulfurospirillaceae bacterium]MDD2825758.1 sulfatase-like hydrolase/transferase [Sulfurospirillaceae bacterium]